MTQFLSTAVLHEKITHGAGVAIMGVETDDHWPDRILTADEARALRAEEDIARNAIDRDHAGLAPRDSFDYGR